MNPFASVDADTLLSGSADWLEPAMAERLAEHPLDCVGTEYPHLAGTVESAEGPARPTEQHPVFYGCFDWHSAVHSHWCLIRQLRLIDDHPLADELVVAVDARLSPEGAEQEVEYFESNPGFERPYGWGWFLRLAAELALWDDPRSASWRASLQPLEDWLVGAVEGDLLTADRSVRVGTHGNSAFALACIVDYARVTDNGALEAAAAATARDFYLDDRDYPARYEPLGWDFLSPTLAEADLMRRVLDAPTFADWLDDFLPDLSISSNRSLLEPVAVDHESAGGAELHLVGLNLSKAWGLAGLADAVSDASTAERFRESAAQHATAGLGQAFTENYAGSHWLSSFALYLVTRNAGGIAPAT